MKKVLKKSQSKDKKTAYRYKIKEFYDALPRSVNMIKILKERFNIVYGTFWRDSNVKMNSSQNVPMKRLEIYAGLFGVTVPDLMNYDASKKIKPLVNMNVMDSTPPEITKLFKANRLKMANEK